MVTVRLVPPDGRSALPVGEAVRRLQQEFKAFEACPVAGQDYVCGKIQYLLRLPESTPGRQERIDWLESALDESVYVWFGDGSGRSARCCVMPESDLSVLSVFRGDPDDEDETIPPSRPLVERAALALGYTVSQE